MKQREFVIIDDIDEASALLTPLGQDVVREPAQAVRDAVTQFAARHRWLVMPHASFVNWAMGVAGESSGHWLALDPLFPPNERIWPIRVTRAGLGRCVIQQLDLSAIPAGDGVGLIDDAVASGVTIMHVGRALANAGVGVKQIAVCASHDEGLQRIMRAASLVRWRQQVPGDRVAAHLRDGCPHLPFTGLRDAARLEANGASLVRATPAYELPGGLWQVMIIDSSIRRSVFAARRAVAQRLSSLLRRQAVVGDLSLLGTGAPLFATGAQLVTMETPLDALVPAL